MIVCICASVTTSQVLNASHSTLEDFKENTGACMQCCACHDMLNELWENKKRNEQKN
jgi:bacterioferritin-associated ferredoxin